MAADVPSWLQVLAAAGEAVGGLATAAAVVYGYVEFKSWKRRAQSTDRAAVAARVLAALDPFCWTVKGWINQIELAATACGEGTGAGPLAVPEALRVFDLAYKDGLRRVTAWHRDLEAAQFSAQAYLTKDELASVQQAITVSRSVQVEYEKITEHLRKHGDAGELISLVRTRVLPLHPEVGKIRDAGVFVLRRIARHETPVPASSDAA